MSIRSEEEVYSLLKEMGAMKRLIIHSRLVGEASEYICAKLNELGVAFDQGIVELGVAFHDAGNFERIAAGAAERLERSKYMSLIDEDNELLLLEEYLIIIADSKTVRSMEKRYWRTIRSEIAQPQLKLRRWQENRDSDF